MIYRLCLFTIFLSHAIAGSGITSSGNDFSSEIRFIQHLQARGHYHEALFLLENLKTDDPSKADTINYLKGWMLYSQKDLEASAFFLEQVRRESPFFDKSNFFAAYNYTYLGNTPVSLDLLAGFETHSISAVLAMANFQKAGIALLDRRFEDFELYAEGFIGEFAFMAAEERKLGEYYSHLESRRNPSPALAGIMSAAVPGLGRIYAGKTAEGIAGFLYVGAMALTTWDFYNRLGPRNGFFISSAAITGVFYIGNILGSATAARRTNNEFNYEMDQRILLDMHIPLRRLFP